MTGYTPLFQSIVMSSIWQEDSDTCKVWVTMLALANADGIVEGSIVGLAHSSRVTVVVCQDALEKLLSPDLFSRTKDDEGRRIREVDGGWLIINHKKYRQKAKSRAEYYRKWRAKKKVTKEEKEENTNTNLNSNSETTHNTPNSCAIVAQFPLPPQKQRWMDIAFKVGLTDAEAENSYDNYGANGWKRANDQPIESWEQVPHLLTYWRNNRQNFKSKQDNLDGKTKLFPLPGKTCSKPSCRMPAVYKATGGDYDFWYCAEHMPESVKDQYYA